MANPGIQNPGWQRAVRGFVCTEVVLSIEETRFFAYFLKNMKIYARLPLRYEKRHVIMCIFIAYNA